MVLVATVSYAQALASSARVDAAQAQVETAQALFYQATDLKQSGIVAGIDVLRAEVQLGTERQRATAARNELEKAKLQLARLIGLPLGQSFTLATELAPVNIPEMTLEQAVERAYRTRPDYLAALERDQGRRSGAGGGHRRDAAVRARQRELRGSRPLRRRQPLHLHGRRHASTSRSSRADERAAAGSRRRPTCAGGAPTPTI